MEFGNLGQHCKYPSCHQRDFLPFTCKHCDDTFCLEHRTPLSHECASYVNPSINPASTPVNVTITRSAKCEFDHCKRRDLTPVTCRHCRHTFCIAHRFPHTHHCEAANEAAKRDALAKRTSLFKANANMPASLAATATASVTAAGAHAAEMHNNTNIASRSRLLKPQA